MEPRAAVRPIRAYRSRRKLELARLYLRAAKSKRIKSKKGRNTAAATFTKYASKPTHKHILHEGSYRVLRKLRTRRGTSFRGELFINIIIRGKAQITPTSRGFHYTPRVAWTWLSRECVGPLSFLLSEVVYGILEDRNYLRGKYWQKRAAAESKRMMCAAC